MADTHVRTDAAKDVLRRRQRLRSKLNLERHNLAEGSTVCLQGVAAWPSNEDIACRPALLPITKSLKMEMRLSPARRTEVHLAPPIEAISTDEDHAKEPRRRDPELLDPEPSVGIAVGGADLRQRVGSPTAGGCEYWAAAESTYPLVIQHLGDSTWACPARGDSRSMQWTMKGCPRVATSQSERGTMAMEAVAMILPVKPTTAPHPR